MQELSKLIKEKRKAYRLSQRALASKAGVGVRFIREMERGKPTLQMHKVNQVLVLFGYQLGPIPVQRKKLHDENS